jgi:hypothetical protein
MKRVDVYGVMLSSEQAMMFAKYMVNNNIAMNTKTPEERKAIVQNWLSTAIN